MADRKRINILFFLEIHICFVGIRPIRLSWCAPVVVSFLSCLLFAFVLLYRIVWNTSFSIVFFGHGDNELFELQIVLTHCILLVASDRNAWDFPSFTLFDRQKKLCTIPFRFVHWVCTLVFSFTQSRTCLSTVFYFIYRFLLFRRNFINVYTCPSFIPIKFTNLSTTQLPRCTFLSLFFVFILLLLCFSSPGLYTVL